MHSMKRDREEKKKPSPKITIDAFNREMVNYDGKKTELKPAFDNNNVAVCVVSSDEYAPFAAVLITSIVANASEKNNYDLVIISDDMTVENIWQITSIASGHPNISVRVIDVSDIVKGLSFYTWAHFTCKTYYRLLTPDLFKNYEKVVYMDSDIVVNHDIAELYNIDLGNHLLGNAYDTHVVAYCTQDPPLEQRDYNIETLKLDNPEAYYQMGVTVYNIPRIRNDFGEGYFIRQGATLELRWLDQDVMNMLCQGNIMRIPQRWNVMVANMGDCIDEYYLPDELRQEYFEARRDPYAIHYVGRAIPCYTSKPDLYEYFWKYARMTSFYEIILQRSSIEAANRSAGYAELREYIEQLQVECRYLRGVVEQSGLKQKLPLRTRLRHLAEKLLPVGTARRAFAAKIYLKVFG